MVREYDCGGGIRLVKDYDGIIERKGWFFSHWNHEPWPEAVNALWPMIYNTAEDAYAALVERKKTSGGKTVEKGDLQ